MQKSDSPRQPLRDIGEAKATDRAVVAIALALAVLFGCVTLYLTRSVLEARVAEVEILAREAAETLGSAVADDFAAAIALGIPLDKARGVDDYLKGTLRSETLVSEIGIRDINDAVLYREPAHAGLLGTVRVPIVSEGTRAGWVVVTPSSQIVDRARWHLTAVAIAASLVLAVLVGVFLRLVALERINLPQVRLGASASAAGRGVYGDFTPPAAGPLRPIGQSAVRLTSPLRRRYRQLMEMTDEVRALDTSGALAGRISAALTPLADLLFDRPLATRQRASGRLWWPLAALMPLLAARPLVASFTADRIGEADLSSIFIALTIAAFAVGALLGLALSNAPLGRGSKLVSVLGMIVAGGALGITAILRDPYHFILAQFLAGLFGVWAVAAAFQCDGAAQRLPWRGALVLLPAIAIGMPLGALLAEAEGRRLAFATIGGAAVVAAILAPAGPARRPRTRSPRIAVPAALLFAGLAVALAIVSFVDISLSAAVYREDYAGLALATALVGTLAFLPAALLTRRIPALAVAGAILAALTLFAAFLGVPAPAAAAALGLALGGVIAGLGAFALTGPAAAAYLCGALLAALAKLASVFVSLPNLPIAGALCAVAAVLALGQMLRGRRA